VLTDPQREALDRDGFIQLTGVLSAREVAELRALCDDLMRSGDGVVNLTANVDIDDVSPVARRPQVFRPELGEMSGWLKLLALGGAALGPDATLCNSAYFVKPPRIGGETFWHQDEAFYEAEYDYRELKVWAALDDIDDRNSPLEYVPGSHKLGVLPHRTIDDRGQTAVLADVDRHCRDVRRMLMRAGDVLVHRCYMLHHAPANRSDRIRRALIVNMMLPPTRRAVPVEMPWKSKPSLL
jgi:hypothetical protein